MLPWAQDIPSHNTPISQPNNWVIQSYGLNTLFSLKKKTTSSKTTLVHGHKPSHLAKSKGVLTVLSRYFFELGIMAHTCKSSTFETEARKIIHGVLRRYPSWERPRKQARSLLTARELGRCVVELFLLPWILGWTYMTCWTECRGTDYLWIQEIKFTSSRCFLLKYGGIMLEKPLFWKWDRNPRECKNRSWAARPAHSHPWHLSCAPWRPVQQKPQHSPLRCAQSAESLGLLTLIIAFWGSLWRNRNRRKSLWPICKVMW